MDTLKIKTKFIQRIFWVLAVNFGIISMLVLTIILSEDSDSGGYALLLFLFALYSSTFPFIYLLFSRYRIKRLYQLYIFNPQQSYGPMYDWYIETTIAICRHAGMKKLPEIAVYQDHDLNAFATGRSKNSSLIAVSTGLLEKMSPDGIEGVIAHEVAHIMNGDMVTQTLVQSTLNLFISIILFPLTIFRWLLYFSHNHKNAWVYTLYIYIEAIISTIIFFLASLITKAFSRSREFQADLLGSQLTHPHKMIQALNELGGGAVIAPAHKANAANLFNGSASFLDIFSTHPSIKRRIQFLQRQTVDVSKKQDSFFSWKAITTAVVASLATFIGTQMFGEKEVDWGTFLHRDDTKSQISVFDSSTNQNLLTDKEAMEQFMQDYSESMVAAINSNDYSIVEPYIKTGSTLEHAQKKLITHLASKNITEEVNVIELQDTKQISETLYHVISFESIYVISPTSTKLTEYTWVYELEVDNGQAQLTDIKQY